MEACQPKRITNPEPTHTYHQALKTRVRNDGEDDRGTAVERARVASEEHHGIRNPDAATPTAPESRSHQELPNLTSSQSIASGGNDPKSSGPLSSWDEGREASRALYESAIAAERARSGPHGRWRKHMEKEQQWLDDIQEHGGAVNSSEMKSLFPAWGQDIAEDEQRMCCIEQLEWECRLED